MGCFSTEQIAWEVLKTFLGKSEQMNLEQATIVAWDVDVVGENGMTVLTKLEGESALYANGEHSGLTWNICPPYVMIAMFCMD